MKKLDPINDNIISLVLKFMLPSIIGMIGLSLCIFLDTMFIGRGIGNNGLAALNISLPVYSTFTATGLIFGVGGATLLSINIGRKKYNVLNEIFTTSIVIAFGIGIIFSIVGSLNLKEIAILLGASNELLPLVIDYLKIILFASFMYILSNCLNVFVRNDHDPKVSMWAIIVTNIINIILDYIFIFPLNMGMKGAALATTIGQCFGVMVLLTHFFKKSCRIKLNIKRFSYKYIKRIITNGFASFILEISGGIVILMFNMTLLRIGGDIAVSAYSIIANVALIFIAIFSGISQGIQPLLGTNYGANKFDRVISIYKIGTKISFILGTIFFFIGILEPQVLVSIFSSSKDELMEVAKIGIMIYFVAFIPAGVNIVNIGFLQAIERSKFSIFLSLMRGLVLIFIILNIFSKLLGLYGVWMTIPVVEFSVLIISTLLVSSVKNKINIY